MHGDPSSHSYHEHALFDELSATPAVSAAAPRISVGPMVGGVTAQSAKVFVRTVNAGAVRIEYSRDAAFSTPTFTPATMTAAINDFTTIHSLNGLVPESFYFYRVHVDGQLQQTPLHTFKTFPVAGTVRNFSFAVTADLINASTNSAVGAPAYASLAADNPLFMLQIGDFDHRNPGSLTAMRAMHRSVLGPTTASGADFERYIAANMPVAHVWDDHDYGINNGDKTFAGRSSALKAFREYYPTPNAPNLAGIWHSFSAGQIDVMMLDVRSQRDPVTTSEGPGKSMLDGDNIANGQKAWLKAALLNSTATWKFVVSGVPFNPTTKPADAWGAYATERNELLNFIRSNDIEGVIIVSGDLHSGGGIDNGTNAGVPEITVPHTNLNTSQFSSGPVGTWSQGVISGVNNPGYALIQVDATGVTLQVKGANGQVKKSLRLTDDPAPPPPPPPSGQIVYRINTGGPQIAGSPAWSADTTAAPSPFSNATTGGNSAVGTSTAVINMTHPSIPAGTPMSIFQNERFDKAGVPNLLWDFPVTPGQYEVRLYFAETNATTSIVGGRVFDVMIEGATRLDNYDIFAEVGRNKAMVKSFIVTSDANLDIDFLRVTQNPTVTGIEILRDGAVAASLTAGAPKLASAGVVLSSMTAFQFVGPLQIDNAIAVFSDRFAHRGIRLEAAAALQRAWESTLTFEALDPVSVNNAWAASRAAADSAKLTSVFSRPLDIPRSSALDAAFAELLPHEVAASRN
jgi:alkaline phosphatase D